MLEGIRVVEIEGLGPAPFAGMLLADLGAEVIVVHRPVPPAAGMGDRNLVDRGKQSIVLDLKTERGVQQCRRLAATADALIEGFRPGVMERLGLGPEELQRDNPPLVYGRMTGWGQDGPKAGDAGHDLNYIGVSGALWYASPPGTAPFTPPTLVGDIGGGALYLVAGMLAGLLRSKSSGRGTVVDAAIVDGSAHMLNLLMSTRAAGLLQADRGQSLLDGPHWSRCYATADGAWLSVQCIEPAFYTAFLARLGLDEDALFREQHDARAWSAQAQRLEALFASRPLAHWLALFEGSDACVAPVLEPGQAAAHPHMAARQTWVEAHGHLQARTAPRFDGRPPADPAPAPRRGEHTDSVLASLAES